MWQWIIVSKYGYHPYEWLSRGVKGMSRNTWKEVIYELPVFSSLISSLIREKEENRIYLSKHSNYLEIMSKQPKHAGRN